MKRNEYRDEVLPIDRTCVCGAQYDGPDTAVLSDGWRRGAKYKPNPPFRSRDGQTIYHVTTVQPVAICPACAAISAERRQGAEASRRLNAGRGETWGT